MVRRAKQFYEFGQFRIDEGQENSFFRRFAK